jgi:hypothetical protein
MRINRLHLVYDLFVTNPTSSVMKLEKLQTLDASRRDAVVETERGLRIVETLAGPDLDGGIKPLFPVRSLALGLRKSLACSLTPPSPEDGDFRTGSCTVSRSPSPRLRGESSTYAVVSGSTPSSTTHRW